MDLAENCMPDVKPYTFVVRDEMLAFGPGNYRILLYRAFDALGVIGTEYNGIVVLDETKRAVIVDDVARCDSGYSVPTMEQDILWSWLLKMDWETFRAWVNNQSPERLRYQL